MTAAQAIGGPRGVAAFLLVVVSLVFLSVVPYLTFREIEVLQRQSDDTIEPARDILARFEVAVARRSPQYASRTLAKLDALSRQLSKDAAVRFNEMKQAAAVGDVDHLLLASSTFHQELQNMAAANRSAVLDAQRRGLAWSVALFMLTLISMLALGWLIWRQRLLVEQVAWARTLADRGARDEQALRAAAAAVAAPLTTKEVVREIARGALRAAKADGAYAARLDRDGSMHVIATAGQSHLGVDAVIPYEGTVYEQVVRDGGAAVVHDAPWDHNSNAIVVPMIEADGPIGVLTLLYENDLDDSMLPLLLARANTFGDLAAIALHKARLLERSEERRLQLESVEQSRARLLRGFSHDIRNPLANADGFLQLLQLELRGPLTPPQLETLKRARASLSNGLRLLRDLLDFAIASVGRIPLNIAPCSLPELLQELVADHRAAAETKHISLTLACDDLPQIRTDADRVRQVLDNLVSNAVKYTNAGGSVVVHSWPCDTDFSNRAGHWVRVDVSDNGRGIAREQQAKVFYEFTRLTPVRERGTGIGLAISQWLANALGGRITLESEAGKGSTFTFWLPTEAVEQAAAD